MRTQFEKKTFVRALPENVCREDVPYFHKIRNYDCPALFIHQFKSVNILPDSTLFKGIFPLDLSFPFFKKRLKHHNKKGILYIILKWKRIKLKENLPFVIIHDPWTKNYYHWITQALPRLLLVKMINQPFILLLPEDHQTDFHIASLKLMEVHTWRIIERGEKYFNIHNLWYPTHDIQIGDYNDELIVLLRSKLHNVAIANQSPTKIFIRRTSRETRRIINEAEVLEIFQRFGFKIMEFENMPFGKQILAAGSANVLAGVHGAGLTNMIFMPPQSVVFELTSRINGEHYYYYALSNSLSHKYYYQSCASDKDTVVQQANLTVDINKLKDNISLMLNL